MADPSSGAHPERPIDELSAEYLRSRGLDIRDARELGGGVSNIVLWAELPGETLVFKQSLPKLRVAEEWLYDQRRIFNERRCMEWLETALPGRAPRVRFRDDENFIFGMSAAPEGGRNWKTALLDGDADVETARSAGAMLGEMHARAAAEPALADEFGDSDLFIQGRIDPYHRFTARAHPDLAPLIDAEVARMLSHRVTLVHGDYSPKNLIAYSGPPAEVMMLDFEVAHWGDPAFDTAFCLAHLLLTAIHFPARRSDYLAVAQAYCQGYGDGPAREADTLAELGCLLLARIDGKSKEDYIATEDERAEARHLARWLLVSRPSVLGELWEKLES